MYHINDLLLHELLRFCSDLKLLEAPSHTDVFMKAAAILINFNLKKEVANLTAEEATILLHIFKDNKHLDTDVIDATIEHLLNDCEDFDIDALTGW